jgi:hypothetical protein
MGSGLRWNDGQPLSHGRGVGVRGNEAMALNDRCRAALLLSPLQREANGFQYSLE